MNSQMRNRIVSMCVAMTLGSAASADCSHDIDGDCRVGLGDVTTLLGSFGCTGNCQGDLNRDGVVDLTDLTLLLAQYGNDCAPAAPTGAYASAVNSGAVTICWTDSLSDESAFRLYRREGIGDPNDPNGPGADWQLIAQTAPNASCATDSTVETMTFYEYVVRTLRNGCESQDSNVLAVFVPGDPNCPAAPTGLRAEDVTAAHVTLCWDDSSEDENGFRLYRRDDPNGVGDWHLVAETPAGETCATDSQVDPNTVYEYEVRAFDEACESDPSDSVTVTTPGVPCSNAPSNLRATDVGSSGVSLCWDDLSNDESGFRLYRRDPNDLGDPNFPADPNDPNVPTGGGGWRVVAEAGPNAACATDNAVAPNRSYEYLVRAYRDQCESGDSNIIRVDVDDTCLHAPSNCNAARDCMDVVVTWQDNSSCETSFNISRSVDQVSWNRVGTVGANETTFRDTRSKTAGQRYHYRVRAVYDDGAGREFSAYSNIEAAIPRNCSCLQAPSHCDAARDCMDVVVTWQDNSSCETSFNISRSVDQVNWNQVGTAGANETTFRDTTSKTAGQRYHYRVRAVYDDGDGTEYSGYSNTEAAIPRNCSCLQAPSNCNAARDCMDVVVTWQDNSSCETSFNISRSVDQVNWNQVGTAGANGTTYRDTSSKTPGQRYHYRVRAVYDDGDGTEYSEYSNTESAIPRNCACLQAPSNCNAARDCMDVVVTWQDNSSCETSFNISRSVDQVNWNQVGAVGANETTYRDTSSKTPGQRYHYRVRAVYDDGEGTEYSEYSNTEAAIPRNCSCLQAPSNCNAARDCMDVVVTWQDNSSCETSFNISRSVDQVNWNRVGTVGPNVTTFRDTTSKTAGQRYYYRVRAVYDDGEGTEYSEYSNTEDAIPRRC